ncbi:hypothetical protein CO037_00690 [Candidatus Pacearchaeota archaeon CG_4_9_14_0_2_um_filter_30_8]|nr:MAG: hypothetical protein CO037_00690 [Candidatus Pacearchaeota archaeon CG_4_9_14_0_2_um_filter_30_8]
MTEEYEEVKIEIPNEENEDVDIEVTEVFLSEDEINYWISSLEELREKKEGSVSLSMDEESELIVTFDEDSEGVEFEEDENEEDEEIVVDEE